MANEKAVLISIQPKWCELIVSGKKNVEVRKSAPKLKPPFKVYIYCSKGKDRLLDIIRDGDDVFGHVHQGKPVFIKTPESSFHFGNSGKVIAEFTCYRVIPFLMKDGEPLVLQSISGLRTCLTKAEVAEYIGNQKGYMWQISGLKVYDNPKPLKGYYKECAGLDNTGLCDECENAVGEECDCAVNGQLHLTRPPQSWCYVEELNDGK
ncbi:MAG: ASCH domain-containing protein [Oscillospiraceae bacterium]|nr:ASCH domain-containing protein [Oscillospiraceae bacterium]